MIEIVHIVILAIIQGLTEFLPVSSSAHLILVPKILAWPDQGIAFDIAVHFGTLFAIVFYFRQMLFNMTKAWFHSLLSKKHTQESRLAWAIVLGTIPVGLAGLLLKPWVEQMRSPLIIASTTLLFGLLLGFADKLGGQRAEGDNLSWKDVCFIGTAQVFALIPGTSRSGVTLTAGLMRGLTRKSAAQFSFLLAIPVITLASLLNFVQIIKHPVPIHGGLMATGVFISGLIAYFCVDLFMRLLDKLGMLPFVVYRVLLSLFLFWVFV